MRLAFWRKKKTEPQNEVVYSVTTKGWRKQRLDMLVLKLMRSIVDYLRMLRKQ